MLQWGNAVEDRGGGRVILDTVEDWGGWQTFQP